MQYYKPHSYLAMNPNNIKSLIYCRVSSQKQDSDGSGNSAQETRCRDYAMFKGYEVEAVFQDKYTGGGNFMKRPAMRQLLAYVDEHPETHYVVIFDDLKRFARDVKFHWELRKEFQVRYLKPECLNFTFDETPEGAFIETIIAAQGELERHQNKRAVMQKMIARMQRGIYCLGTIPYGYTYVKSDVHGGKILQIHEHDAEIAKTAFERFANGSLFHIKDVAHFLNTYGTKHNKKSFTLTATKNMLTNILYTGYVEYPRWNIALMKGIHEPIISLKVFEQVQERIQGKIPQRTRKDMREDFPLRGYINCIHCHHPLTASWSTSRSKEKHPYYRCNAKECIMKGKSITQKELHDKYLLYIEPLTPKPDIRERAKLKILSKAIEKQKERYAETVTYKEKIDSIELQISTLIERITAQTDKTLIELYEKEVAKLNKKKLLIEAEISQSEHVGAEELEPLVDKAFEPFENPYVTWQNGKYRPRKLVQDMLFNANLEYKKNIGFGTAIKSIILRLYEEIERDFAQNSTRVHSQDISWNQEPSIVDTHWDELIREIKRIASLKDSLSDKH
jgi:site-specific DNA recombinase